MLAYPYPYMPIHILSRITPCFSQYPTHSPDNAQKKPKSSEIRRMLATDRQRMIVTGWMAYRMLAEGNAKKELRTEPGTFQLRHLAAYTYT